MGQNATNKRDYNAFGSLVQARAMIGSRYNFVLDPATDHPMFAMGGYRTDQINTAFLTRVCASPAQVVFSGGGMNDALQLISPSVVVGHLRTTWDAIKAVNKKVIQLLVVPITLAVPGNAAGAISTHIVSINSAIIAAAAQDNVDVIDVYTPLLANPAVNNGVGHSVSLDSTGVHPSELGALQMGRVIAAYLRLYGIFTTDPFAMGQGLCANPDFTTTPSTSWTCYPPAGTANGAQSVITEDGRKIWRLVCPKGTSVNSFVIQYSTGNILSGTGYECDSILEYRINAGVIKLLQLSTMLFPSGSAASTEYHCATTAAMDLSASDSWMVLRTPAGTAGASTGVYPSIGIVGVSDFTIDLRYYNTRRLNLT